MNSFEQYRVIMTHLKTIWTETPSFYEDEKIENVEDYVVFTGANIDNSHKDCQTNVHTVLNIYKARFISPYRGRAWTYAAKMAKMVCGTFVSPRLLIECKNINTVKLERDLFESTLTLVINDEVLY